MAPRAAALGTMRLKNFRLEYVSAELAAVRRTHVRFYVAGVEVTRRVRRNSGATIRDLLNDAPNTAAFTLEGAPPLVDQVVRITINNDAPRLLFDGVLDTVTTTYKSRPTTRLIEYQCRAIDDTPRANARLPFGAWANVSATTVAQEILAAYAPAFSAAHIQAGLPAIDLNLNGSEGMNGAMRQIAKLIGGYFYWEDFALYLFTDNSSDPPDAIDDTPGRFLNDPPIADSVATSQIRTRVLGVGHGEATLQDVAAGETILPVGSAALFNPAGGRALAETQRLTYTGVQVGGAGTLVGPGIGPGAAPAVARVVGGSVEDGAHNYAVTFLTAVGESLPSPLAAVTLGTVATPPLANPTQALTANPAQSGGQVPIGTVDYVVTFGNPYGETLAGPVSNTVTTGAVAGPGAAVTASQASGYINSDFTIGESISYRISFATFSGPTIVYETAASPISNAVVVVTGAGGNGQAIALGPIPALPAAATHLLVYRYHSTGSVRVAMKYTQSQYTPGTLLIDNVSSTLFNSPPMGPLFPPSQTVPLINIPIGPAGTASRELYRRVNSGSFVWFKGILNNVDTSFTDNLPPYGTVIYPPSSNNTGFSTVYKNVQVSAIPIGGAQVTGRRVYRTPANAAQLRVLVTLADNVTTTLSDNTTDAGLGANLPPGDTSGIQQPNGQVVAGSPSMPVAGAGAFAPGGGWARIGNGAQVIRYANISGGALAGIPVSGLGAITATVAYNSTITATPALTGVAGNARSILRGVLVNLLVQRDDLAAQADLAARASTPDRPFDGIIEHRISDERRGEASLAQLCEADLELFSHPIETVTYACRDVKTKSGKPVVIDLDQPAVHATLTIQDVTITELDTLPGVAPKFTVTASSVRASIEDLLRRLAESLEGT